HIYYTMWGFYDYEKGIDTRNTAEHVGTVTKTRIVMQSYNQANFLSLEHFTLSSSPNCPISLSKPLKFTLTPRPPFLHLAFPPPTRRHGTPLPRLQPPIIPAL